MNDKIIKVAHIEYDIRRINNALLKDKNISFELLNMYFLKFESTIITMSIGTRTTNEKTRNIEKKVGRSTIAAIVTIKDGRDKNSTNIKETKNVFNIEKNNKMFFSSSIPKLLNKQRFIYFYYVLCCLNLTH